MLCVCLGGRGAGGLQEAADACGGGSAGSSSGRSSDDRSAGRDRGTVAAEDRGRDVQSSGSGTHTHRERERERDTHTHTHTHTHRGERGHTQRERDTHKHTQRERDTHTHTHHTQRERQAGADRPGSLVRTTLLALHAGSDGDGAAFLTECTNIKTSETTTTPKLIKIPPINTCNPTQKTPFHSW